MEYEIVIGLEVHVELSSQTKVFCGCKNEFGLEVNTLCCPVCLGMPGTLPTLNEKVVEYALKMGLASNCAINKVTKQDRKNYFYPDLPKSFQISQVDTPLCHDGYINILIDGQKKKVGITQIHIEEDTGKLLHDVIPDGTLIDFNRCSVPLIEIVSAPDMRSAAEAKAFLETIKAYVAVLGISDAKMQEGSIRCDVNVSVMPKEATEYGTRCEMKNINTFSGAVRAIEHESRRHMDILDNGGVVEAETLRWDDTNGVTIPMRKKGDYFDYLCFPDPDLKTYVITDEFIEKVRLQIPELPNDKVYRFTQEYSLSQAEAELLVSAPEKTELFETVIHKGKISSKNLYNWIMSDITGYLNEHGCEINNTKLTADSLFEMIQAVEQGAISNASGKIILGILLENGGDVQDIIKVKNLAQISDSSALEATVHEILETNTKSVEDYKNGKTNALGFLVGQCMKATKGQGNPAMLKEMILRTVNSGLEVRS